MAIASRTPTPHVAEAFMRKLGVRLPSPVVFSCSSSFQCGLALAIFVCFSLCSKLHVLQAHLKGSMESTCYVSLEGGCKGEPVTAVVHHRQCVRQSDWAQSAASAAGITDMFESIQLIPASSGSDMHSAQKDKAHLPNIRKVMGVEYRDMLFFDDEAPNITKASSRTSDTSEQCAP